MEESALDSAVNARVDRVWPYNERDKSFGLNSRQLPAIGKGPYGGGGLLCAAIGDQSGESPDRVESGVKSLEADEAGESLWLPCQRQQLVENASSFSISP